MELLDFYHAAEHLQQFAIGAFTESTIAQTWFKQARSDLKRGRVNDLLNRMQEKVQYSSGDRQKTLAGQRAYFTTGQQQQRLNYEKVAAMKLPIGSGAIESLIRGCG